MTEHDKVTALLPPDLDAQRATAWEAVRASPGYLTEREAKFLMLAAAAAPASGAILEIGSFKGRSTVGLALIAKHYGRGPVVAVDPFTSPASTDPAIGTQRSTFDDFQANVRRAGVADVVESHQMFSRELAPTWSRPLRLLWIDGDHTYEGTTEDIQLFGPHLAEHGILAMHDVLGRYPGATRTFLERVLRSDDFGPIGFCGSTGWAQYRPRARAHPSLVRRKARLARTLEGLLRVLQRGEPTGWRRLQHSFWRSLTPHGAVNASEWIAEVSA